MPKTAHTRTADRLIRSRGNIPKQRQGGPPRKFTAWTVAALLEQYRDPRAILLEIASTDTATLAKQMHGTLADALAERRLCAQAVLPYLAQKLPVQVDMRHTRAIVLNIVDDRQYEQLVTLDAEQDDNEDSFNLQLVTGQAGEETPAPKRPITWDVEPPRNDVTDTSSVTPPTPSTPTGEE
jgi:hypothetical protein